MRMEVHGIFSKRVCVFGKYVNFRVGNLKIGIEFKFKTQLNEKVDSIEKCENINV